MIDLVARVRAAAGRSADVALSNASDWPQTGGSISMITAAAGRMRRIEGTVVELDPQTAVSPGRMIVQDNLTGSLVELPVPEAPEV